MQQTHEQFSRNTGFAVETIMNLEEGRLECVSAQDLLYFLDKMGCLNDLLGLMDKQDEALDKMADYIAGLEIRNPL
nr:hypothetical protein [Methylomarinum sp. Ch1-1]MDP4523193.1 hypothetical protein [Methylomarinum sp. Ch1-1]